MILKLKQGQYKKKKMFICRNKTKHKSFDVDKEGKNIKCQHFNDKEISRLSPVEADWGQVTSPLHSLQ
jgi:hypothetical protein